MKIILDSIFGVKNFRREIIWSLGTSSGFKSKTSNWIRGHDCLLYYTKSNQYYFKKLTKPHKPEYIKRFKKISPDGRLYRDDRFGNRKQYLDETPGTLYTDVWDDIMSFQQASTSKEYTRYPTQKLQKLLERIIQASSKTDDIILDPFCGCGTAILASEKFGRKWIGIDITHLAVQLIEKRLNAFTSSVHIDIIGIPTTLDAAIKLSQDNKFQFETWAITLVPNLHPNKKQVGDGGVDGRGQIKIIDKNGKKTYETVLAQVKGGKLKPADVRDLIGTVEQENATFGIFICLEEPTLKMIETAYKAGVYTSPFERKYPKIQIYTIQDYFNGKTPNLPDLIDDTKILTQKKQTRSEQTKLYE